MPGELDVLSRAHALFASPGQAGAIERLAGLPAVLHSAGEMSTGYLNAAAVAGEDLVDAQRVDAELARALDAAHLDRDRARGATATVLAAARSDVSVPDNPIAAREMLRRRALRLRSQKGHVLAARRRARRSRAALAALRYRSTAVRAALSRLGSPYVWGATGPDRFDCSGLVKWAYAQAGVPLHRTTYDQINDGVPVARSQVRPGDLVFPHAGHVQMAIGHDLVVEAPQPGSVVRISPLDNYIAIRRVQ